MIELRDCGPIILANYNDHLVDAFLQARAKARELEHRTVPGDDIPTVAASLRDRALANLSTIPDGYFSIPLELFKHLYNLEALLRDCVKRHQRDLHSV